MQVPGGLLMAVQRLALGSLCGRNAIEGITHVFPNDLVPLRKVLLSVQYSTLIYISAAKSTRGGGVKTTEGSNTQFSLRLSAQLVCCTKRFSSPTL